MNQPKVSIIVLNWNGLEDTIECLESLKGITYPNYEVIVVDNGSDGNDAEILRERFRNYVQVIENDKNYGFVEGSNIAIRYALSNSQPDYILLLNNDTVVSPEFLTSLVEAINEDDNTGIAGPKVFSYYQPDRFQFVRAKIDLYRGRVIHLGAGEIDRGQYENLLDTDYAQGSCFLIKREVIERIGLLDSSYFNYWEEADYCLKARKAGYRIIYCPKARIWHKVGRTANKISGFFQYYRARNRFWFMKRHATWRQFLSFILWFSLFEFWFLSGVLLIYHRNAKVFVSFCKGVRDGILRAG